MNLKVTAILATPLAGDAPHLDGLLECAMAFRHGMQHKADRTLPAPAIGAIPIPLLRGTAAGQTVARCSSPILPPHDGDYHEHYAKRLATEYAGDLHPSQRTVIAMGNSTYKSYRLPLRKRVIDHIVWFAVGDRKEIQGILHRHISHIGRKRSQGHTMVAAWEAEEIEHDWSWYAESPGGVVLMRPLPVAAVPAGVIGSRPDFASCQPPYWHPERFMEVLTPC